jgi:putative holliday junction resolvase
MMGRVMAVYPGEKRIGLAISDQTGTIANPLKVVKHVSRTLDAAQIALEAGEQQARLIIIGQALDQDGLLGPRARSALRLAEAIRLQTDIPVDLWDESGSTQEAMAARLSMGVSRRKRNAHIDELAATIILQSYLDAHANP